MVEASAAGEVNSNFVPCSKAGCGTLHSSPLGRANQARQTPSPLTHKHTHTTGRLGARNELLVATGSGQSNVPLHSPQKTATAPHFFCQQSLPAADVPTAGRGPRPTVRISDCRTMRLISAALLAAAAVVLLSGSPAGAVSLRRRRAAVGTGHKSQVDAVHSLAAGLRSLQDVSMLPGLRAVSWGGWGQCRLAVPGSRPA